MHLLRKTGKALPWSVRRRVSDFGYRFLNIFDYNWKESSIANGAIKKLTGKLNSGAWAGKNQRFSLRAPADQTG